MIFLTPQLPPTYLEAIDLIRQLRGNLRFATSDSVNRWTGLLARMTLARAIQSSNTMEGIAATIDDAVAAVDREEPIGPKDENWEALIGHRDAMDYIIQLAKDPKKYPYNEGTILGLHFMMMRYDLNKDPGRWRPGGVHVTHAATGQIVYEGPPATMVQELVGELIDGLNQPDSTHVLVRAAMAHLNLAMIHPFRDGNGRMARALQTMVLSKDQILSPVFSSIEEYVGRHSLDYHAALAEVGRDSWHPENDPLPFIKFCLTAHYRQATTLLRRVEQMGKLITNLEQELKESRLNTRMLNALIDAAAGLKVRNPIYRKQAGISFQQAKLDLAALVKTGLLSPKGERRGRFYVASERLSKLQAETRLPRAALDPFDEIERRRQPEPADLPGFTASPAER